MAGYSGTPLPKKLGVKPGQVIAVLDAPVDWQIDGLDDHLGDDDRVDVRHDLRRSPDLVVGFVRSSADLRALAARVVSRLPPHAAMWVVWPRRAAGHVSDVTEQLLRDTLLPTGLVDVKVAAVDHDWSGLRFVWRRDRR